MGTVGPKTSRVPRALISRRVDIGTARPRLILSIWVSATWNPCAAWSHATCGATPGNKNKSPFRKRLKFHARLYQRHVWAPRTGKISNSEKKTFTEFCLLAAIVYLPVTGEVMYLSPPDSGSPALPVTPVTLSNLPGFLPLTPSCPTQNQTPTMYKALTFLRFLTMSSLSNMVPESWSKLDPEYLLKWGITQRLPDGIIITIIKSKTNQFCAKKHLVPLAASPVENYCLVAALTKLAAMHNPRISSTRAP